MDVVECKPVSLGLIPRAAMSGTLSRNANGGRAINGSPTFAPMPLPLAMGRNVEASHSWPREVATISRVSARTGAWRQRQCAGSADGVTLKAGMSVEQRQRPPETDGCSLPDNVDQPTFGMLIVVTKATIK